MMKKLCLTALLFSAIGLTYAQNVNVNPGAGSYATLKAAFNAINAGTHTGSITVDIIANTTETVGDTLNASGIGSASYTSVTISPIGTVSVSGAIAGPLVLLNGADNVTINGVNSGGNILTISNINNTASASTIRFVNDARSNTVTNTTILGSTIGATLGVVSFGTGISNGNDNNTISSCNISAAGANLPLNCIASFGSGFSIDNSGCIIQNNNISDYFSAALVSNGMNIGAGSGNWTITGNRLFQTANRIYTTSNTHTGITISAGDDYTISDNIIGFANASGTGTTNIIGNTVALTGTFPSSYTTTGTANATRYIAINCAFAVGGRASSIQNNTISGFALYTSSGAATTNGIFCGINVTSGSVNIGTSLGNTIGSATGNTAIYAASTTSGGAVVGIFVSSLNDVKIQNNTIGAINSMGTTASICGAITGINIASNSNSYDVSGNAIGNSTAQNLRMGNLTTGANLSNVGTTFSVASGISIFNGILSTQTGIGNIGTELLPNTITNVVLNSSSATASVRGITATGAPIISSNRINNISTVSSSAALANTLLAGMGIFLNGGSSASGAVVTKNIIHTLSLTNATTAGTNLAGIAVFCANTDITFNQIYNLLNASTSTTAATPGTASGIFYRQPINVHNVSNNMISLGNAQTTNTSFHGIWQQNSVVSYVLNCYNNTINIEGNAASGAQPSFCINRGSYSTTQVTASINLKNNILNNVRTGGTGKHYAVGNNYLAAATNVGWVSNNNALNAAAANIGYWGADRTFSDWQVNSLSDINSISNVSVPFINSAVGDLHINAGMTATQLESGGVNGLGINNDFDAQLRPGPLGSVNGGAISPDLGADEFDGVPSDISGPVVTYTPLAFTCSTSDRILSVSIKDNSGVPIAGVGLPVLYWKINIAGVLNNVQGVYTGGNNYTFTFGSGVAVGDSVLYYIAVQDNAGSPNVIAYPSIGAAGYTASPPAASTPPTNFEKYKITNSLGGTYTVGAAGVYPTITAAVNDYNKKCLTGAVVFELLDAAYSAGEVFPIVIQNHPDASSVNTLTIRPASGVTSVVSGVSDNDAIFSIEGNYVTIDGSNSGSTTRDLTILNNSILFNTVIATGSNGVETRTNVTVKNSILKNAINTSYGIIVADIASFGSGYFKNITIVNNDFRNVFNGVLADAIIYAPNNGMGMSIKDNKMNNSGVDAIKNIGINLFGVKGAIIDNNVIGNFESATAENDRGIALNNGCDNVAITNNNVSNISCPAGAVSPNPILINVSIDGTNFVVTGNTISNISSAGTGTSFAGIFNTSSNATIRNNTISNLTQTGAARVYGINSSGIKNVNISKNNITGLTANLAATSTSAAVTGILFSSSFATTNIALDSNFINNVSATNATFAANAGILTFNPCNITNNTISNLTQNSGSALWGIISAGNLNSNIGGNTISGITNTSTSQATGLNVQGASAGVNISRNKVSNIKNTNAAGGGAQGLLLQSSVLGNANILVANNFVSDIAATVGNTTTTSNGQGIDIISGDGYKVYYNTVNMNTGQSLATSLPSALLVTTGVTGSGAIDLRNNIFNHSQSLTTERYAIFCLAPNTVFSNIDYNNYFSSGPNLGFIGSNRTTLADIQTGFGQNLNSKNIAPVFTSATDLHLVPGSNSGLDNFGTPVALVAFDIDLDVRSLTTPDMGADEFSDCATNVISSLNAGIGTLRDAIGCAVTGSTITIDPSVTMIALSASLSISGKTLTIKDADASPVMITLDSDVSNINITATGAAILDNLVIKDLSAAKTNPAVLNDGTLTLKNTKVSGDTGSMNSPTVKNNGTGNANVEGNSTISNQ